MCSVSAKLKYSLTLYWWSGTLLSLVVKWITSPPYSGIVTSSIVYILTRDSSILLLLVLPKKTVTYLSPVEAPSRVLPLSFYRPPVAPGLA